MKALLQRVKHASVSVGGEKISEISEGLLVFVGVEQQDSARQAARMAERIAGYRIFADDAGRMNQSVVDAGGQILAVSQFTLAADTGRGMRPGFSTAAPPECAEPLFEALISALRAQVSVLRCGEFGADMQVELLNDGPVTFLLEVPADA